MTTYIALFIIHALVLAPLVYLWVKGIDDMNKNHPDYKGEDFLN
jgi:hypothetical protein